MPSELVTSGSGLNSLGSRSDADDYFDDRFSPKWDAASDDAKDVALLMAFARLEMVDFAGSPVTKGLLFPRNGLRDRDGNGLDSDEAPDIAKFAQYEIARTIIENEDWFGDRGTEGYNTLQVDGGALMNINHDWMAQELPVVAKRYLAPILRVRPYFMVA